MKKVSKVALVIILVLSVFSLAPPVQVSSAETMTEVSEVTGQTFVIRNGASTALSSGIPLHPGDTLTTGTPGKAKLQFADGSILYLGPGSALDILGPAHAGLRKGSLKVRNRGMFRVQPGNDDEVRAAIPMSEFVVIVGDGVEVMSLRNRVTMGTIRVAPQVSATKRPGEWAAFRSISLVDTEQLFAGLSDSFPKPPEETQPAVPAYAAAMSSPVESVPPAPVAPVQETYSAQPATQVETPPMVSYESPARTYGNMPMDGQTDGQEGSEPDNIGIYNSVPYSSATARSVLPGQEGNASSFSLKNAGGLVGWLHGGEIYPPDDVAMYSYVTNRTTSIVRQPTLPHSMNGSDEIGGLIGWMIEEELASVRHSPDDMRQSSDELGGLVGWWVGSKYQTSKLDTETRDPVLPESETLIGGFPE